MSRNEAVLSALAVFAVALVVRVVAASLVVFPKPEDTAYYVEVARALVNGRGLVADALWSYQTPPLVVPRPAFEVWLPLPSFLAAVPMALLGATFASAQVASVLVGAVVPVLAWRLGADVAEELALPPGRARTLAIGAGMTSAVYLPLVLHSTLPDSTMPFAALGLGACLLMIRLGRATRPPAGLLVGLGVVLGLAALTRNEAIWLALVWLIVAWRAGQTSPDRLRLIGLPAVIALLIFAPWAVRDWIVFGTPLPGQALSNALSTNGTDIFAWSDPPTLARYLAVGPARLVGMRVDAFSHNLFSVLLLPGAPLSFIGLIALPWTARLRALQPVVGVTILTFAATVLIFPIATTWGTFLHAAGPAHVLLVISALVGLDWLIAAVGRRRGWTRPVAWLAPTLTIAGATLFALTFMPSFGTDTSLTAGRYRALASEMTVAGRPLAGQGPVISDYPIWLAMTSGGPSLALPDEPPAAVLDLARRFGARTVVVNGGLLTQWPAAITSRAPGSECFRPVTIGTAAWSAAEGPPPPRVFEIVCP